VDKAGRVGAFSDVGIVQRVYIRAGKAPTTACLADQIHESAYNPPRQAIHPNSEKARITR
jgi:hypothetical protein